MLRELSGYSVTMTYTQVLYVALVRVQDVIIGRFIGTAAVGQYRTAWRTVELISQGVIMPFTQVALPTLGRLQDDLPAFRKAYLRITAVCSAVAVPAIVGIRRGRPRRDSAGLRSRVGGPPLRWRRCSASWRFLSPTTASPRRRSPRWAATAILARFSTLQLVLTVAMSIAAAPYGLVAVAGAYVARAYLMLPLQMWVFKRYSGLGYGEVLRSVAPAFATSALMAAAVVGLDAAAGDALRARHLYLVTAIPVGALVYLGGLWLLARRFVIEQVRDLRGLMAARRQAG